MKEVNSMILLVICPYEAKYLKTIRTIEKASICKVRVIGDYNIIYKVLRDFDIRIRSKVIDVCDDNKLVRVVNDFYRESGLVKEETISLFCNINNEFRDSIVKRKYSDIVNSFYVIDVPKLKHFIYASNTLRKINHSSDIKMISNENVLSFYNFMSLLGAKKVRIAMINDYLNKRDILEASIMMMILKDSLSNAFDILKPCRLNDIFNEYSEYNIFNSNINMLLFRSNDMCKMFFDTINIYSSYRVANVLECNNRYYLYGENIKDEENIVFSILIISKCLTTKRLINNTRKYAEIK